MKASKLNKLTLINKGRIYVSIYWNVSVSWFNLNKFVFSGVQEITLSCLNYLLLITVSFVLIFTGFMHLIITGLIVLTIGMLIIKII